MAQSKHTPGQVRILRLIAEQPHGGIPVNELPTDIDFNDYRACREDGLLKEETGRGGFLVAWITKAGRAAIAQAEGN